MITDALTRGGALSPSALEEPRLRRVLDRLHSAARREMPKLLLHYLPKLPSLLRRKPLDWSCGLSFFDDKLVPVERSQGELLHLLALASRAQRVVELGTGHGVAALYLAAAMRDTGGRYIGFELMAAKAEAARRNLAEAGLEGVAEVKAGDAAVALSQYLPEQVDMLVLDGWPPAALPVLRLVEPSMHPGAVLFADNVGTFAADLRSLRDHVESGPWSSLVTKQKGGTLIAVRLSAPSDREAVQYGHGEVTP